MAKSSMEMLIESGIIPSGTVQQLVKWRAVPEKMGQLAGHRPVSLEKDSEEATRFAEDLANQVTREEQSLRETEFEVAGKPHKVTVHFGDGSEITNVTVNTDQFGHVHVPTTVFTNGRRKVIKSIALKGEAAIEVVAQEPRFTGERVTTLVCRLGA